MTGQPDDVDSSIYDAEPCDRDRVFAEAPAVLIGGMWFTPDEATPGGIRPLTEDELRAITDRVRATQADAVAEQIEKAERNPYDARHRAQTDLAESDEQEWQR